MRTTMTLDDDVAARLEQLRAEHPDRPFRDLVNDLLRAGLSQHDAPGEVRRGPYTTVVSLGEPRIRDLDDVSEVLAIAEGDDHR